MISKACNRNHKRLSKERCCWDVGQKVTKVTYHYPYGLERLAERPGDHTSDQIFSANCLKTLDIKNAPIDDWNGTIQQVPRPDASKSRA